MSLIYNDPTNLKGIVQVYEKEAGFNRGEISGSIMKMKDLTADVNLALDDYLALALAASGTWVFDDSNHEDYPIIMADLVEGRRDYPFTVDGNENLILDIYKVMVKLEGEDGVYDEIHPVSVQTERATQDFYDGRDVEGVPYRYSKTANGIFLDQIPSYSQTGGLKIYINREGSYFSYDDTSKRPGVPGLHHRYFALKPALDYARRTGSKRYDALAKEVFKYEGDESQGIIGSIQRYFGSRERDVRPVMRPRRTNFH